MLDSFRENFRTRPYLKITLIVVAFSLTLYLGAYFGDFGGGEPTADADWAARVNGVPISSRQFLDLAQSQDAEYRQLFGDQYEQFKAQLQLGQQVVNQLVMFEIMRQEAMKLGLQATPEEISREILEDPSFQNADGTFIGKERYTQLVNRQFRGGVAEFERRKRESILARKWQQMISEPANVTEAELEELFRYRNEKTAVDYVVVASADQKLDGEISDQQLRDFYDANSENYRRPEGRRVRYVVVERQKILDGIELAEADLRAYYDTNQAFYARPEQRRARHILFRAEAGAPEEIRNQTRREAESVLRRLEQGEDFETLARSLSQDEQTAVNGGDLGYFARGVMVPPFENAVFAAAPGQLTPIVETEFGFHLIRVEDARPAGTAPFEEVREEIERQLRLQEAQRRTDELASRLSSDAASPADLARLAETEGLTVSAATVRQGGSLGDLRAAPEQLERLFSLEAGAVSEPIGLPRGSAVVAVEEVLPEEIAPLDDVMTRVRVDLLNDRLRRAARDKARRALERTGDFAAAAKSLGLEVQSSGDLSPGQQIPATGGYTPELEAALFGPSAAEGAQGAAPVPAGAILYRITHRTGFDAAAFASARLSLETELLTQRRNAILQSALESLLDSYEVEINQELVRRVDT